MSDDEPTVEDFDTIMALALIVAAYRVRRWWRQLVTKSAARWING